MRFSDRLNAAMLWAWDQHEHKGRLLPANRAEKRALARATRKKGKGRG